METKDGLSVDQFLGEMEKLEKGFSQQMADYQANAATITGVDLKPGQNIGPLEVYKIARKAAMDVAVEKTTTIINPTTGEPAN